MADLPACRDTVVVGGSAGAMPVLFELVAGLPAGFPASLLVVQHIGAHPSALPELLTRRGPNRAVHPYSGQALEPGSIYVAPPDHHLLVVDGTMRLSRGAKENHGRPAIDPLFRTAAIARGSRVIGVILSGRLDDGTAGLQAVKECGGLALVQDPDDAEQSSMPASARDNVAVDHVFTRGTLAGLLVRLTASAAPVAQPASDMLRCEHQLNLGEGNAMEHLDSIGRPSRIGCPDCNGVLWKLTDTSPPRYRCHTGHAFTERTLEYAQQQRVDETLWSALRALHERTALLRESATICREGGYDRDARDREAQAEQIALQAQHLEQLITRE